MKAKRQYCCFLLAMLLSIMLSSCSRLRPEGQKNPRLSGNLGCRAENRCVWRGTRLESFLRAVCAGAFDEFTRQVFKDELEGSGLTLHYMLKDPENYGISTADPKLGECSLEYLQQVSADMEKLSEELHAFDPSF